MALEGWPRPGPRGILSGGIRPGATWPVAPTAGGALGAGRPEHFLWPCRPNGRYGPFRVWPEPEKANGPQLAGQGLYVSGPDGLAPGLAGPAEPVGEARGQP